MNDKQFMDWIVARLEFTHSENPNVDYMIRLKRIVAEMPETLSNQIDLGVAESLLPEYWLAVKETQQSVRIMWLKAVDDRLLKSDEKRVGPLELIMSRLVGIMETAKAQSVIVARRVDQ